MISAGLGKSSGSSILGMASISAKSAFRLAILACRSSSSVSRRGSETGGTRRRCSLSVDPLRQSGRTKCREASPPPQLGTQCDSLESKSVAKGPQLHRWGRNATVWGSKVSQSVPTTQGGDAMRQFLSPKCREASPRYISVDPRRHFRIRNSRLGSTRPDRNEIGLRYPMMGCGPAARTSGAIVLRRFSAFSTNILASISAISS